MGCVLDKPDALRPTGKRRNVIKTATMREVMKYGGWRKAVEAGVELPPMGGGALTLVNSGTVTPTVGTNNTVATDTPGAAQMYVVEVDCENMRSGDSMAIGVRRGTTKATPQLQGVAANGGTQPISSVVPAANPLLFVGAAAAAAAPSDTQSNAWSNVSQRANAGIYGINPIPRIPDGTQGADWLNDQVGLGPAYQSGGPDTLSSGATGSGEAIFLSGIAWGIGGAYATATAAGNPTTSASVNAGDMMLGVLTNGATGTVTALAGWTFLPFGGSTFNSGGNAAAWQVAPGGGTVTMTPTWSAGATTAAAIAAFPAMTGLLVGKAVFRNIQAQSSKQSTAFLINASEQISFDLFQIAGTARAFPWRLYHL